MPPSFPPPVIFAPLQYHPECNTDYWPTRELADYENDVVEVLASIHGATILAKEHPLMVGSRPPTFYRSLKRIPGLALVPHTVSARELIRSADLVISWPGSTGIEAAAMGKSVIGVGRPYYASGPLFSEVATKADLLRLDELVARAAAVGVRARDVRRAFLSRVLSCCVPGFIWPDAWAPRGRSEEEMDRTAASLGEALPQWLEWRSRS